MTQDKFFKATLKSMLFATKAAKEMDAIHFKIKPFTDFHINVYNKNYKLFSKLDLSILQNVKHDKYDKYDYIFNEVYRLTGVKHDEDLWQALLRNQNNEIAIEVDDDEDTDELHNLIIKVLYVVLKNLPANKITKSLIGLIIIVVITQFNEGETSAITANVDKINLGYNKETTIANSEINHTDSHDIYNVTEITSDEDDCPVMICNIEKNLHSRANDKSKITHQIEPGTECFILRKYTKWYYVSFIDSEGNAAMGFTTRDNLE